MRKVHTYLLVPFTAIIAIAYYILFIHGDKTAAASIPTPTVLAVQTTRVVPETPLPTATLDLPSFETTMLNNAKVTAESISSVVITEFIINVVDGSIPQSPGFSIAASDIEIPYSDGWKPPCMAGSWYYVSGWQFNKLQDYGYHHATDGYCRYQNWAVDWNAATPTKSILIAKAWGKTLNLLSGGVLDAAGYVIIVATRVGDKYYYISYWHMDPDSIEAAPEVGTVLESGAFIGYTGATGAADGAHIHLRIDECDLNRTNCHAIDPEGLEGLIGPVR